MGPDREIVVEALAAAGAPPALVTKMLAGQLAFDGGGGGRLPRGPFGRYIGAVSCGEPEPGSGLGCGKPGRAGPATV